MVAILNSSAPILIRRRCIVSRPLSVASAAQPTSTKLWSVLFPALTLLLILLSAGDKHLSQPILLVLLVAGVVILGLPHGAFDPLVAKQLWHRAQTFPMLPFLLLYTGMATLSALFWLYAPNAGLIVFLLISAYHFGSDWEGRSSVLGRGAFGVTVVTISSLRKSAGVEDIFTQLGASLAHNLVVVSQLVAILAIACAFIALATRARSRISNLVEFSTVVVGGLLLPPLLFFTCYFCLLHSPRHLMQTAHSLNVRGVWNIARIAAPTVLATIVLALGLWRFLPATVLSQRFIQVVFIGLAALTVPHMLLTELARRRALHDTLDY